MTLEIKREISILRTIRKLKEVNCMATMNEKGKVSVSEAGRRGGEKTSKTHGREFYQEIGHKGGQKVRDLINRGKSSR